MQSAEPKKALKISLSFENNMDSKVIYIGSSRQLFIDDYLIDKSSGIKFAVNSPVKTHEKLIIADCPWEDIMVGPYCTVMDDDGVYKMWYESYAKDNDMKAMGFLCYAESEDGLVWRKPTIGKIPFRGSNANNIVFPNEGKLYHGGTVFKDSVAEYAQRYKMVYAIHADGLFGAYSSDGVNWSTYDGYLLRNQCDTQNVCFWDGCIKKYVCYVRHNVPIRNPNVLRTVGRSETEDFLNWPPVETVLSFDQKDPPDMDFYNSAAIKYARADDVYIIITSCYHHTEDVLIPQLATSRDGITWNRIDRKPFLELGKTAAFDSGMIHTCVGQVIRGDEIWIYYRGIEKKHNQPYSLTKYGGTITRAVLRVDGFVSVDADSQEGFVFTKPLIFSGNALEINCKTESDGYMQVQMDALEDCQRHLISERLAGDMIDKKVNWPERKLRELNGVPVKITFKMKNSKLFSFRFRD
ncbi:MAG: hypothetical protein A2Y13_02095 [Planctomycetes bacterium GWC2_45_44]|nr:MAG: hypothetical protein A2Y13_02095 [Planctomycetes bacterium GWC2_45_44]